HLAREEALAGRQLLVIEVAAEDGPELSSLLDEEEEAALEPGEVEDRLEDRVEQPVEVELARDRHRQPVEPEQPVLEVAARRARVGPDRRVAIRRGRVIVVVLVAEPERVLRRA